MVATLLERRRAEFDKTGGMPTVPSYDPALLPRLTYLTRVESMIAVGCHYGPGDLDPSTWDQLILLNTERQYVDALLADRRESKGKQEVAMDQARQASGIPKPGQTIFKHSKAFKGPTS